MPGMADLDFPLEGRRVFVAGHRGMVGSAIVRALQQRKCQVLTAPRLGVDLRRQGEVERWMESARPDAVFLAAARVGGIGANSTRPAEFIYDNLAIQSSVIESARRAGVGKLLFLGSSCIYPKFAPQPIPESALLSGPLEPTNEWYAVAKIAGIKLCQAYRRQYGCNYISLMPTNLYGPGDDFDLDTSHVIPALMRKMYEARCAGSEEVVVWGTGSPKREFLHVGDLADAALHLMESYTGEEHVNVGTGRDISIADLAQTLKDVIGFQGRITYDPSMPDGTPRKLLDVARATRLGWRAKIGLREGLADTYRWFVGTGDGISRRAVSSRQAGPSESAQNSESACSRNASTSEERQPL